MMPKRRKSDASSDDFSDESAAEETQKPVNAGGDDSSSSSSGGDHEWTSSGIKKSKKKKKVKSSKSGQSSKKHKGSPQLGNDDEREEGEVEDDDEEEKSEDDFEDEFNDGYDENLMGDEADQARLANMTEKEREEELFNRSEKREVLRARFQIERKLRMQRKASDKSTPPPPLSGQSASPTKTNSRRRNLEDKNSLSASLRHLKEQREKKKAKQQRLRAADVYSSSSSDEDDDDDVNTGQGGSGYSGPVGAARKSSSSSSSDSSSDDSDMDGVSRHRSHKPGRHHGSDDSNDERDYVISLADLNSIRVTRNQVEAWCHTPFFAKTIKDAFVKMGIGAKNSKPIYRIVKILDVVEGPDVYRLNKTRTNKLIKVRYGKSEKTFRLEYISNSDFAANEFTEWKEKLEAEKIDLPKRSAITLKQAELARAANYQFNESEIEFMVREKAKFNKNPSNYAMKKTQLLKEKEHAEQMNNYIEAERIQKELNEIEERAKELDKQRTHSIAAISFINERNRAKNIQEAEKAILAEAEKERASGQDDPFRRRKCAPTLFTLKNQKNQQSEGNGTLATADSVDSTPKNNSVLGDSKSKPLNSSKERGNSSPNPVDDGDLFNAHNFDIHLDFDIPTSKLPPTAPVNSHNSIVSLSVSSSSNNRRSLNLEEYKKKKGLI